MPVENLKTSRKQPPESKKMYDAMNVPLMCCKTRRLMLKRSSREEAAEASFSKFTDSHQYVNVRQTTAGKLEKKEKVFI